MNRLIISIHIPKTAGTTFGAYLKEQFQQDLLFIYQCPRCERGLSAREIEIVYAKQRHEPCRKHASGAEEVKEAVGKEKIKCLHGHFDCKMFSEFFGKADFIVWLRHPVDRTLSHYEHFLRMPQSGSAQDRQLMELSARQAFYRRIANLQCKITRGLPLNKFKFIGIAEKYEESLERFNRLFNLPAKTVESANINPAKGIGRYFAEEKIRREIESMNKQDVKLYAQALRLSFPGKKRVSWGGFLGGWLPRFYRTNSTRLFL